MEMNWRKRLGIFVATAATAVALALTGTACRRAAANPDPDRVTDQVIAMKITERGFEPNLVHVTRGRPVQLVLTRTTERTCARDLILREYDIHTALPLARPVTVRFTPTQSGRLRYGCAMGMMIGGILVID